MIFGFQRTLLVGVGSVLAGAVGAWWVTADYKDAKYQAEIAAMRVAASESLQAAVDRAMAAERANVQLAQELEVSNAKRRKELDQALADNRRLVRELGGLRDPFAKPTTSNCPLPASPATPGESAVASTSGQLSAELTEFLLSETRRADEAAAYAQTCYDWVQQLTRVK